MHWCGVGVRGWGRWMPISKGRGVHMQKVWEGTGGREDQLHDKHGTDTGTTRDGKGQDGAANCHVGFYGLRVCRGWARLGLVWIARSRPGAAASFASCHRLRGPRVKIWSVSRARVRAQRRTMNRGDGAVWRKRTVPASRVMTSIVQACWQGGPDLWPWAAGLRGLLRLGAARLSDSAQRNMNRNGPCKLKVGAAVLACTVDVGREVCCSLVRVRQAYTMVATRPKKSRIDDIVQQREEPSRAVWPFQAVWCAGLPFRRAGKPAAMDSCAVA